MLVRRLAALLTLVTLTVSSLTSTALARTPRVVVQPYELSGSARDQSAAGDFFSNPEIWEFNDLFTVKRMLEKHLEKTTPTHHGRYDDVMPHVLSWNQLSPEMQERLKGRKSSDKFMEELKEERFVVVDASLRRQLPDSLVRDVYATLGKGAGGSLKFKNGDEFALFAKHYALTDQAMAELRRSTVIFKNGVLKVFFSAESAANLPVHLLDDVARFANRDQQGYRASLILSPNDDLHALAVTYKGDRDLAEVEKLVRQKFREARAKQGSRPEYIIALKDILPPFVQAQEGKFAPGYGPNCYNSGLCSSDGENYVQEFTHQNDLTDRLAHEFRLVLPGEPIQPGDQLLYLDAKGFPLHVATYWGRAEVSGRSGETRDLVFTKNGKGEASPYFFADRQWVEDAVYPDTRSYMVWRRAPPGHAFIDQGTELNPFLAPGDVAKAPGTSFEMNPGELHAFFGRNPMLAHALPERSWSAVFSAIDEIGPYDVVHAGAPPTVQCVSSGLSAFVRRLKAFAPNPGKQKKPDGR